MPSSPGLFLRKFTASSSTSSFGGGSDLTNSSRYNDDSKAHRCHPKTIRSDSPPPSDTADDRGCDNYSDDNNNNNHTSRSHFGLFGSPRKNNMNRSVRSNLVQKMMTRRHSDSDEESRDKCSSLGNQNTGLASRFNNLSSTTGGLLLSPFRTQRSRLQGGQQQRGTRYGRGGVPVESTTSFTTTSFFASDVSMLPMTNISNDTIPTSTNPRTVAGNSNTRPTTSTSPSSITIHDPTISATPPGRIRPTFSTDPPKINLAPPSLDAGTPTQGKSPSQDFSAATKDAVPPLGSRTSGTAKKNPYDLTWNEGEPQLGCIRFDDSYNDSLEYALKVGAGSIKPIFCLHAGPDHVYTGRDVFSHPLVAEAIETLYVPIHEGRTEGATDPGDDQQVDETEEKEEEKDSAGYLHHRQCRGPCLRFVDQNGDDLSPRLCGSQLTRASVITSMIDALEAWDCDLPIPKYLRLLREEEQGRNGNEKTAIFGVEYSARAEAEFAGLDGILATRTGFQNRQRVVEVTYDSKTLQYGCLVRHALKQTIAAGVIFYRTGDERIAARVEIERAAQEQHATNVAELEQIPLNDCADDDDDDERSSSTARSTARLHTDHDPKHYLRNTPLRFVPLTPLQAIRANRLVYCGKFNEAMHLLSPRQGLILMRAMQHSGRNRSSIPSFHEVVNVPIVAAWMSVCNGEHPKQTMKTMRQRCGVHPQYYDYDSNVESSEFETSSEFE